MKPELNAGVAPWPQDQADGLRRLFGMRAPQVVAFASGRTACGRTTLLVQTAAALAMQGQGVLIVDENSAPNNVASAFGLTTRYDFLQVLSGYKPLRQVLLEAAPLLRILPAARAARELEHASRVAASARINLLACLQEMQRGVGFVLIDAALRRSGQLSPFALAAAHMTIVLAAQGPAITQSYALIKRIAQESGRDNFQIVITRAKNADEGRAIFDNMRRVARDHLGVRLDYLGGPATPVSDYLAGALKDRLPPAAEDMPGNGFSLAALGFGNMTAVRSNTPRAVAAVV